MRNLNQIRVGECEGEGEGEGDVFGVPVWCLVVCNSMSCAARQKVR